VQSRCWPSRAEARRSRPRSSPPSRRTSRPQRRRPAARRLTRDLSAAIKSALEKRVDAAVAAGRITKAQGDELKQRIESGDFPLFGFGDRPVPGMFGHDLFRGLAAAAAYLGLSEDELHTQLENGKTLADIAKAQNKSVDGLVQALVADAKKHLDEEVAEGDLTKAQADQMLMRLEQGIRDIVNGVRPNGMPGPGFGFPPRLRRPVRLRRSARIRRRRSLTAARSRV
jgi:hypothetical protein